MTAHLRRQGHRVAACTLDRLMRDEGLSGADQGGKHRNTIASGKDSRRAPDLLDRDFTAPAPNRIREEVSGPTHADTLTARANLAGVTGAAGGPAAARDQYTALLPTIEEVFGPRHPDTLTARADLAHWTALASGSE